MGTMYCGIEDLSKLLPEADLVGLADDSADGSGDIDSPAVRAVLEAACDNASREVDGWCEGLYRLPLDPVPGLARALASVLAVAQLFDRRPGGSPEHWEKRRAQALSALAAVAKGNIRLGPAPAESIEPVSGIAISSPDPIFGPDLWERF